MSLEFDGADWIDATEYDRVVDDALGCETGWLLTPQYRP
jgi:hypothetical protein